MVRDLWTRYGAGEAARTDEVHYYVTSRQFTEAWEAMQQALLLRGLTHAGVSSAQIICHVSLALLGVGLLLVLLTIGMGALAIGTYADATSHERHPPEHAEFAAATRAVLILSVAVAVVALRPRSRAESHLRSDSLAALVEEVLNDDLARAAED